MKVYLAGPYGARETIRGYAWQLRNEGFSCTSSWLEEQHEINAGTQGPAAALPDAAVSGHALQDLEDVNASGYTYAQIARRAGVDPTTVSKVMNGRRAGTVDTWDLILIAAGVELVAVVQ